VTRDSVECRSTGGPERFDAFALMRTFRSDERRLSDALALFVEREDYALETRFAALEVTALEIMAKGDPGLAAFAAARGLKLTAGLFAAHR
jgi:hypothetical protein